MGPVPLTPVVEQVHDGGDLIVQKTVDDDPTRPPVGQISTSVLPAFHPPPADLEHIAGSLQTPALADGVVDQVEQSGLAGGVDTHRDGGRSPPSGAPFPSTNVSLTANSASRATSALAASSSTSRTVFPTPGLDADSAAIAPSLATCRTFMIVDRSTLSAAPVRHRARTGPCQAS
ncbi:MAG: hypothetical protein IPL43_00845 [Micropruina sp.]|nr:hypothetical protein [Micropruina sp.]